MDAAVMHVQAFDNGEACLGLLWMTLPHIIVMW